MKFKDGIKFIWYQVPCEVLKGAIKGQFIRIINPKRYKKLRKLRLPYRVLFRQRKELIIKLKKALDTKKIKPLKIICRIKTIGGIDRKERYINAVHPKRINKIKEDFLGLTIVTKSKRDCYAILKIFKELGKFPRLKNKQNPRDHFKNPEPSRETNIILKNRIHGNLIILGFTPIHIRILTKEVYFKEIINRGLYKKNILKIIKKCT